MGLWNNWSGKTLRHKVSEDEVHRDENMHNGSGEGVFLELVFDQLMFVLITDFL